MFFQSTAIVILLLFYGCYFIKMILQKKKGIETDQIGKGKTGRVKAIELTMKVATILVPLTEVLSICRNASLLSGEEKMDFTVFTREESEELFDMMLGQAQIYKDKRVRTATDEKYGEGFSAFLSDAIAKFYE